MQNDIDNEYLHKGEEILAANLEDHPLIRLGNLMPWLIPVLVYVFVGLTVIQRIAHRFIESIEENPRFWFLRRLSYLVDLRKSQLAKSDSKVPIDLLQLLLDAGDKEINGTDPNHLKSLHADEIVSNIMLFLVAGYETTSTALAYSSYVLAREPHIQKKLQAELDSHPWDEHEYEEVMKIPYLEWFVNEVLRMFPIAPLATSRECNTTSVICGHTIEAGSVIQADMYTIHYDPDLWGPEDPNKFIPERHATPRHPMAYMPFGLGPRNCIGKRLALMEIKMCLARLLRHYSIYPADDMEEKFHLKDTLFILQPTGVYVKIEKRFSSSSSE